EGIRDFRSRKVKGDELAILVEDESVVRRTREVARRRVAVHASDVATLVHAAIILRDDNPARQIERREFAVAENEEAIDVVGISESAQDVALGCDLPRIGFFRVW